MSGRPARRWPLALLLNLLLLPFCLIGLRAPDGDTFYHLAAGRWMFEHGRVLDHETFSFLIPGRPWTNYYWGFEALVYAVHRLAGIDGVLVLRAALILATCNLFLYWVQRRTRGSAPETLAFGLLCLAAYLPRALSVRPHLFSYLFLLLSLMLLEAFRRSGRWVSPWLLGLCVLWANLHGVEYPVLFAAIGLYALEGVRPHLGRDLRELGREREVLRWPLLLVACTAALLVNPFAARLLLTPRVGADAEVMAQIQEMAPVPIPSLGELFPSLRGLSWVPFNYAVLAGACLVPFWLRRRQWLPASFFVLGLALALARERFQPEFLMLAVPFIAEGVAAWRRERTDGWPAVRRLLWLLGAYVAVASVAELRAQIRDGALDQVAGDIYPIGAMNFIRAHGLSGNLYCNPGVAGYATWSAYPQVKVMMDMRTPEPFGAQELWLALATGSGQLPLNRVRERWPLDLVLAPRQGPLAAQLRPADSGYAPIYADQSSLLFADQSLLSGARGGLRLETLPLMERVEAGMLAGREPVPDELPDEAHRLVEAWPANHLARRALLWSLLSQGHLLEVRTRATELARQFPRVATYPFFASLAARGLGEPAQALAELRRAAALEPGLAPALAEALSSTGREREALVVMERHAWKRWTSLSAGEYRLLGSLRRVAGRPGEAAEALERARWLQGEHDPTRADLDHELSLVELSRGDARRALELADSALSLRPDFPLATLSRARALRRLGRGPEAQALLDGLAARPELPAGLREAVEAERGR